MKKILAIILSLVMLLCCVPFSASAADEPASNHVIWDKDHTIEAAAYICSNCKHSSEKWTETCANCKQTGTIDGLQYSVLLSNVNYTLKTGNVLTIAPDVTAVLPLNSTLVIETGATLRIYGELVVQGQLRIDGLVEGSGSEKIRVDKTMGSALAAVRFPSLASQGLNGRIDVSYGVSATGDPYSDLQEGFKFESVNDTGETVYVPLNQYIYVKAAIKEPEPAYDKFDDSLMKVYVNNVPQNYGQGSYCFKVVSSSNLSYSPWTSDYDFLSTFEVLLQSGEGYTVYGREGEQSAPGETVKLKYGQTFAFKVELDPEYDMSVYEVYIYNGYGWTNLDPSQDLADIEPAKPDEYGYYTIENVKGPHTIYVAGVVANETLLMVGNILDMVKNVFEMISAFFAEILALFGLAA